MGRLYVGLLHFPVRNKNGETVTSAITNLDLHDIARACRTYGVDRYYVATPLNDQHILARRILEHWMDGAGGQYNPQRRDALSLVRIVNDLDEAREEIRRETEFAPKIVATSSRGGEKTLRFPALRKLLDKDPPILLVFGTAWGFVDEFYQEVDHLLEPIRGAGDYNHLSVRSAASIILDRLCGA
jgi:hypothetical protein